MKKYFVLLFVFVIFLTVAGEKQYSIKKIKYLTPEVLDEKVMKTYLGFKEGDKYTEAKLAFILEKARLRLREYGVFNNVEILDKTSSEDENSKIIFISLTDGFSNLINAGLWWGQVGWKNVANRGDYLGFKAGINKNEFESMTNIFNGTVFFSQTTGWEIDIDNPFFPFIPLYGNENQYKHTAYSLINLGFKYHPDITFGFSSGIKNFFTNDVKNLSDLEGTHYDFKYNYSVVPVGMFLKADYKYLAEKWYSGFYFSIAPSVNFDIYNKQIYPEIITNFKGGIFPNKYISIINDIHVLNTILSEYKNSVHNLVRGDLTTIESEGNFLIANKVDFRVKLFNLNMGTTMGEIGLSTFYEGAFVADDFRIMESKYYNIVGGGLWYKIGKPVDLTVFAEIGYTIGKDFGDGYKLSIGLDNFF